MGDNPLSGVTAGVRGDNQLNGVTAGVRGGNRLSGLSMKVEVAILGSRH